MTSTFPERALMPGSLPPQPSPSFTAETRYVVLTRDARLALRGEPHALAVYCALLDRVAGIEGEVHPGYAKIAEDSGVSVRQIPRALTTLEKLGLVVRTQRKGQTGQISNLYTVRALSTDLPGRQSAVRHTGAHPHACVAHEEESLEEEPKPRGDAPVADTPERRANVIAKRVHERRNPAPPNAGQTNEIALLWINAGFEEAVIEAAMVEAGVCTKAGVELAMSRRRAPAEAAPPPTRTVNGRECRFSPGSGWIAIA